MRLLLSEPLDYGGGGGLGGRVAYVGRALQLATCNLDAAAPVLRLLLQDAAAGQGQGQVGQRWLDAALRVAVFWGANEQPRALAEVLGLLAAAGAATAHLRDEYEDHIKHMGGGALAALALALRAVGAREARLEWEALQRAVTARDVGQLRALLAAGLGDGGTA